MSAPDVHAWTMLFNVAHGQCYVLWVFTVAVYAILAALNVFAWAML